MQANEETLDLQGFSYQERSGVLPQLDLALAHCGGWITERRALSPNTIEISLEVHLHGIMGLYSVLIASGLELTRKSHGTLGDLCTLCLYRELCAHTGQVLTLRLELSFLDRLALDTMLATGPATA